MSWTALGSWKPGCSVPDTCVVGRAVVSWLSVGIRRMADGPGRTWTGGHRGGHLDTSRATGTYLLLDLVLLRVFIFLCAVGNEGSPGQMGRTQESQVHLSFWRAAVT